MQTLDLLIIALAAWRLASLLVQEAGPYRAFERWRDWLGGRKFNPHIVTLRALFECVWCMSLWTSALLLLAWHTPVQPAVFVLAASALAIAWDRVVT